MGIMRPEIPESALRGQVQSGFWPSGCPSGVQVNLHFATRSTYKWIQRFVQKGLEGLEEKPGRGRRRGPLPPDLTDQYDVDVG